MIPSERTRLLEVVPDRLPEKSAADLHFDTKGLLVFIIVAAARGSRHGILVRIGLCQARTIAWSCLFIIEALAIAAVNRHDREAAVCGGGWAYCAELDGISRIVAPRVSLRYLS